MKQRLAVLLALAAVGLAAGWGRAADTLEAVKQKGVLTVGVKYRVPPFGFVDPATGDLAGYDVDLARAIAAKLGVQVAVRPVDQVNRIPELLEGNIDLIAANMTAGSDTGRVIDFSDAYLITGQGFLAKKGTVQALTDLSGKKIGVLAGSVSEAGVRRSLPSATVVPFTDLKTGLQALHTGEIDAASGDSSLLPALVRMLPAGQFEIPRVQISEIPYSLGVRKGDANLLNAVNLALKELEQSGDARKLVDRWFRPAPQEDGPAAEAAGAIVRRASIRPGVVVVVLKGRFVPGAGVSVFELSGDFFCKGKVTSVFSDQIYVDVDADAYDGVQPGFVVGMNVNAEAAKGAIAKHQDVLKRVQEQARQEEEAYMAQREKEGIEQEQRRIEADQKAYESKLRVEEERARNEYYYDMHSDLNHARRLSY